ncbi:bifunctional lysylphosphatidylglycerol flippase/synthetase MprF [Georgenia sp. SYP-B2076]|uniref:bifunctional lysylphosphatidylglycerol flippase/synthetase MprF n=1 Tax=Georgenia sp. SYP-B2076 TaxID=2495881 RepID=UPI000F8E780B|nr:phosphatidylglycerol lysyltransferase domain-containing protein [Georgenia sp. SYP-B2076]
MSAVSGRTATGRTARDDTSAGTSEWLRRDRSRRWAAYVAAALGLVGLLSALSRPLRGRVETLLEVMPIVVPRTAVLTLVFVSVALVLTARGLRHGQRLAWLAAGLLLLASVVLHLIKGLDVEEATLATVGVVWLATQHRAFPVLPTRVAAKRAAVLGIAGVVVVVGMSLLLAVQARPGAVRALGAFAGPVPAAAGMALLGSVAWLLLTPGQPEALVGQAHRRERERAREVMTRCGGDSLDFFALRDDKHWFFTGRSVVAHAVRGNVCLVSPDPIGPGEERADAWAEFMAYAERSGWSVAVVGAAQAWLPVYEATGLRSIYPGDEAVVDCRTFTLTGHAMQSVRRAHRRVGVAGFTATFHEPATMDDATRSALLELSTQGRRGEGERGFSMTLSRLFDPADVGVFVAVGRDPAGHPVAFIQWVPAARLPGWSLDVMRRSTTAQLPNGVNDFLIVETIAKVRELGGSALSLNFAMWRRVVAGEHDSAAARVGRQVLRRMSRRAQIESLWRFNAKYGPRWVPRYAAVGAIDLIPGQGLAIADVEGFTEVPVLGRLVGRRRP